MTSFIRGRPPITEPMDWVNSMVTVVKPNKVCICTDLRDLNKAIKREHHPMNTIEDVATRLCGSKVFSVLDANQGFYQIKLAEQSSKYTAFNTPYGRYKYLRMPMGIASAPEKFQSAIVNMFSDISGVECVMDDILIHAKTQEEHDEILKKVLNRAREQHLKLNRQKCKISMTEVDYVGHVVTADGLKPSPSKVTAIHEMIKPSNKDQLRSYLGMVTYLSKFIPNFSDVTAPLRSLMAKEVSWHWDKPQEDSFKKLSSAITQAPVLKFYDPRSPVTLSVDASSKGLGAVILQDSKPVAYASKALTKTEQNYAQIEKEMLAILFGCIKFHKLIYGRREVDVESDHKPLESIFKKPLYMAPMRLQKMLLKLQPYNLQVKYRPGRELYIADALSRVYSPNEGSTLVEEDLSVNMFDVFELAVSPAKLEKIKAETDAEETMQHLRDVILSGWPDQRSEVSDIIKPYWNVRDEL